ncbi:MAG: hypothetical protein EZS28_027393, partial [Streblomastix strix]
TYLRIEWPRDNNGEQFTQHEFIDDQHNNVDGSQYVKAEDFVANVIRHIAHRLNRRTADRRVCPTFCLVALSYILKDITGAIPDPEVTCDMKHIAAWVHSSKLKQQPYLQMIELNILF